MNTAEEQYLEAYKANEADLGRFLVAMVRDVPLAEEILQEVWTLAWKERRTLAEHPEPRAWLFLAARNRALNELRRSRRASRALGSLFSQGDPAVSLPSEAVEVLDLLKRTLSPADQALFVLRYAHGFNASELAAMTAATPEAIRQRLARSRARLSQASSSPPKPHPTLSPLVEEAPQ